MTRSMAKIPCRRGDGECFAARGACCLRATCGTLLGLKGVAAGAADRRLGIVSNLVDFTAAGANSLALWMLAGVSMLSEDIAWK